MKFIKKNNFQRYEDLLKDEILSTDELGKIKGGIRIRISLDNALKDDEDSDSGIIVKRNLKTECYITGTGGNCHIFDRE